MYKLKKVSSKCKTEDKNFLPEPFDLVDEDEDDENNDEQTEMIHQYTKLERGRVIRTVRYNKDTDSENY